MSEAQKISDRIKIARKSSGLSQGELAEKVGVSQGFLSHLEKGRHQPTADFVNRLTHVLDINAHWLLTGQGEMRQAAHSNPQIEALVREHVPEWKVGASELTADERRFIIMLRAIAPDHRQILLNRLTEMYFDMLEKREVGGGV